MFFCCLVTLFACLRPPPPVETSMPTIQNLNEVVFFWFPDSTKTRRLLLSMTLVLRQK